MRVNVLSYEPAGGWILYDYAAKLARALKPHVDDVSVGFEQAPGFDVTFHVNYAPLSQLQVPGLHCTMVTHIDTAAKFALVRAQAQAGVLGFCMSEESARRLNTLTGAPRFFNYAPPAMLEAPRKRLTVLITGRIYDDGRKNEDWAIDFFRAFAPGDLVIRVMGAGWERHLAALQADGYEVEHAPSFDGVRYRQWLQGADHLLVTGNDEGALSTLDALLYGVVPIVTAQGYHLEQEEQPLLFATHGQLMGIAARLRRELDETNARRSRMTDWDAFARKHAEHWRAHLAVARAAAQIPRETI